MTDNDNDGVVSVEAGSQVLKFTMPKQFPSDEILNKEDRIARGWASVEVKDSQGEIVPIEDLRKSMSTWMFRGGFISDQHTNRIVGKGLRWYEDTHKKSGKQGIVIDYQIFKNYTIDNAVWAEIKSGKRKGLSFGGRATNKPTKKEDSYSGETASQLNGLETYEMASVFGPANELSENTMVNYLAKSNENDNGYIEGLVLKDAENLAHDLQKGCAIIDVKKPFAGFETFDACVLSQTKRGHNEESSKRICGWLKNRYEDKDKAMVNQPAQTTDTTKTLKGGADNKNAGEIDMTTKEKKENGTEEEEEEKNPPKEKQDDTSAMLSNINTKMDKLIDALAPKNKQDVDEEDEESAAKPKDKPDDEKKADEENSGKPKEKPEDENKSDNAADAGDAPADGGDATTDETTPKDGAEKSGVVETSATNIDALVDKKVKDTLKSMGITNVTKSTTPRVAQQNVTKNATAKDPTMEMLAKAKNGTLDKAEMNRDIRKQREEAHEQGLKEVLASE